MEKKPILTKTNRTRSTNIETLACNCTCTCSCPCAGGYVVSRIDSNIPTTSIKRIPAESPAHSK